MTTQGQPANKESLKIKLVRKKLPKNLILNLFSNPLIRITFIVQQICILTIVLVVFITSVLNEQLESKSSKIYFFLEVGLMFSVLVAILTQTILVLVSLVKYLKTIVNQCRKKMKRAKITSQNK